MGTLAGPPSRALPPGLPGALGLSVLGARARDWPCRVPRALPAPHGEARWTRLLRGTCQSHDAEAPLLAPSPGGHHDGLLSRVNGEAVGGGPRILARVHLWAGRGGRVGQPQLNTVTRELCAGPVYADYGGLREARGHPTPRRPPGHRAPDYSPVGPALSAENQAQGETVSAAVSRGSRTAPGARWGPGPQGAARLTARAGDQALARAGPEGTLRRLVPAASG